MKLRTVHVEGRRPPGHIELLSGGAVPVGEIQIGIVAFQKNTALVGIIQHRCDGLLVALSQQGGLGTLADDVDLPAIHIVIAGDHQNPLLGELGRQTLSQTLVDPFPSFFVVFGGACPGDISRDRHDVRN